MGPIPCPDGGIEDVNGGNAAHVDAQEGKVDACQSVGADAGDGSLDLLGKHGNGLCGADLIVIAVSAEDTGINGLDDLNDLLADLGSLAQNVGDGLADDGKQGEENQQRDEAPQAAAAHGNPLFLVQLLHQFVLLQLVVGVASLNVLNPGGQTGHFHHALLGLGGDGQQNHLHQNGEQQHGNAVVLGGVVQDAQQPAEGHGNQIG